MHLASDYSFQIKLNCFLHIIFFVLGGQGLEIALLRALARPNLEHDLPFLCKSCQSDLPKQHFFRQRDPGQGVPRISMTQVSQSWQKNNR